VYVYDDSGVSLLDYYVTYRVLQSMFADPVPAPMIEEFVAPPVPDYTPQASEVPPNAEVTEFPDELRNVADLIPDTNVPDEDPVDDPTPTSDNGS
jgi:hypothetical protein